MAHRSPRESELLSLLEEQQRKLKEYEHIGYRRVFDVDTKRTDITTTWGVCLVRDKTDGGIIVEFYSFTSSGWFQFVADYYSKTLLEDHPVNMRLAMYEPEPKWVLEWNDYRDIIEDIRSYVE